MACAGRVAAVRTVTQRLAGASFAPGASLIQRSRLDRSLPAHFDGGLGPQGADLYDDGAVGRRVFDHELGPQSVAILEVGRGLAILGDR